MPVQNKGKEREEDKECLQIATQVWHLWKERGKEGGLEIKNLGQQSSFKKKLEEADGRSSR